MSQFIELPDTVYNILLKTAEQEGTTPAEWIAERLPKLLHDHNGNNRADMAHEIVDHSEASNAWDVLDALTGTIEAPEDWSSEHDHYITGSPKRQKET